MCRSVSHCSSSTKKRPELGYWGDISIALSGYLPEIKIIKKTKEVDSFTKTQKLTV